MPEIAAFAQAGRSYCAFVESAYALTLNDRLFRARQLLAELIAKACALPEGDANGPESALPHPPPGTWPGFGSWEFYEELFDPYEGAAPVGSTLSDDFLEIYSDVAEGLEIFDSGHPAAASWTWRFAFESHWGNHATGAMRALHRACFSTGLKDVAHPS